MSLTAAAGVLSFDHARQAVLDYAGQTRPPGDEISPLPAALGRIVAEPVLADRDFPPFARSTRDGFAVRAMDVQSLPTRLRVTGQIRAGEDYSGQVSAGEAVEIMTGAAVPPGADSVVMVEHTSADGNELDGSLWVEIERGVIPGENVVARGTEGRAGTMLIPPGTRLTPPRIAMAAAAGAVNLKVFRPVRVAILATGDELVDIGQKPGPFQIRNSNSYSLAAQVTSSGSIPVCLPIARDEERHLETLLRAGLNEDLLLVSGGVSMGKFDLVEKVLRGMGAEFFFTGALIQPGKPVVFGEVANRERKIPFFALPGNPLSVLVTFDLFVRPLLEVMSGGQANRLPAFRATLSQTVKTKTGLTRFLPAEVTGGLGNPMVAPIPWQGSGDLLAAAKSNCYLVLPPDRELIPEGETVSVLLR